MRKTWLCLAAALTAVGIVTAAGAQPVPQILSNVATLSAAERERVLLEGAKKEGSLTIYESMAADDMQMLADAFSKKYGIKTKVWRAGSEAVLQKVVTESRANRFEADVVENNAPEMEALHREKLLQPVTSPMQAELIPEAVPAHKEWVGTAIDLFVQAYNTQRVKKEDLPTSYRDLLDPKWKGRLGIEAEDHHWFATLVDQLGTEEGTRLFKEIVATNGISVRKGHSLLTNLTASGEVPLSLTNYVNRPAQIKQKGAPIEAFLIQPAIGQFRGLGVTRNSPHPHAALLFYDFMLSDGQRVMRDRHYVVSATTVDSPYKNVKIVFMDPGRVLDKTQEWIKFYDEVVVRRGK
ncbi:ABC transporter substrate-binding protein [Pigmentiphaga sp. NML080357]|uniref:ABC transporter substrate-binding protein n=1 Tax=Pigmentiphaga sp. NML080357 TaxID=2008675 RepID=UPI000B410337|nr:extracellular solute-binding protein [Pigmentiphaga sp. NML080357]OVZ61264.1 ABC transporter substrate-binding protein [Pigmentiphaga sp. NML080357]